MGKMKTSAFFTGKDEEYYNGDSMASKRRRSFELMYNPQNHMRRRELTEVLDMHRCHGCGLRFGTISLLERHIRVCKHKEKIKEMHSTKTTVASRRIHKRPKESFVQDARKQKCRYCDKLFTYIGMLKKHILDICPVRKEYFEHGNEDHIDKEWEETIMCIGRGGLMTNTNSYSTSHKESTTPDNMSDVSEDSKAGRKRKGRGRRKNRKWGNQNKTRRKSPDNSKNGEVSFDDGQTPPKSPESSQNIDNDAAREEGGNYSDDTEASVKDETISKSDKESYEKISENGLEFDEMSTVDSTCDSYLSSLNVSECSEVKDNGESEGKRVTVENIIIPESDDKNEIKSESERSLSQNSVGREIKNIITEMKEINPKVPNEDSFPTEVPAAEDTASRNNKPDEQLAQSVKEKNTNATAATKSLFDLDSTIARLKERTSAVCNSEEVEGDRPDQTRDKPMKKMKKKKVINSENQADKQEGTLKSTKPKQTKSGKSTEKPSKKSPKNKETTTPENKSKSTAKKRMFKKDMDGEITPTGSLKQSDLPPGKKRGRKPKLSLETTPPNINSESLDKTKANDADILSSETSITNSLSDPKPEVNNVKNLSEKSAKKTPKGRAKVNKKAKTEEYDPTEDSLVDSENLKVSKAAEISSVPPKEPQEQSAVAETAKPRKGGRKKKVDVTQGENDDKNKVVKGDIPNGILNEEKDVSPPKGKRGPKKRKNAEASKDSSENMECSTDTPVKFGKSPKLKQAAKAAVDNVKNSNTGPPKASPPKRCRKPANKEKMNNPSCAENGNVLEASIVRKKPGPKKRTSLIERKDLLVPDKMSIRSSSRSASRSTSRSRSTSVQRDLTPPPPPKKSRMSSTKAQSDNRQNIPTGVVRNKNLQDKQSKTPNSNTKLPGIKTKLTVAEKKKAAGVVGAAKITPAKGKDRGNNKR